jgi:cellulose synthase/poly-beta-1,6-N-acetylglucosamine synthase-like glycosyltransferase
MTQKYSPSINFKLITQVWDSWIGIPGWAKRFFSSVVGNSVQWCHNPGDISILSLQQTRWHSGSFVPVLFGLIKWVFLFFSFYFLLYLKFLLFLLFICAYNVWVIFPPFPQHPPFPLHTLKMGFLNSTMKSRYLRKVKKKKS